MYLVREDDISQKCVKQYSKMFISFLDMRVDTKTNFSSIRDELGVPQAPYPFRNNLRTLSVWCCHDVKCFNQGSTDMTRQCYDHRTHFVWCFHVVMCFNQGSTDMTRQTGVVMMTHSVF